MICDATADTPTLVANGDIEVPLTYVSDNLSPYSHSLSLSPFIIQVFHLITKCACFDGCTDDISSPPTGPTSPDESRDSDSSVSIGYIGIIIMIL